MTALAKDRNTLNKELGRVDTYRVAAGAVIFQGAMVCLDSAGFAIPAADTAGITRVVGWADELADNTGGAAGDISVKTRTGVALFENDGTVVQATVGDIATVLDDQTVSIAATTTNDITAGTVIDFDDDGSGLVALKIHDHA